MRYLTTLALAAAIALPAAVLQPRPAAAMDPATLVWGGLALGAGYLALRYSQNLEHPWYYRNLERARHANMPCGYDERGKWRCYPDAYGPGPAN